jgi:hypothetical protein
MSDKKISQFNELTTATNADLIPIVDVATNETKFITKENLIPNASFIENIVVKTQADATLELDKINWVTLINDHTISAPTPDASNLGKIIIVNNRSSSYSLTITGLVVMPVILNGYNSIIGIVCVTDGVDYGWEVFSRYNLADFDLISQTITNGVTDKSPSEDAVFDALALKLDLDGGNANQDIDIDGFGVNAKHFKVNGTGGAGHIGLKHQSANISASASESSIGADIVGDPVWKNDGGAIDKLELQSNKTSTVTGNEASTTKYLTVKGVYDWAVGLFAPKASPTFTGTITTPDIVVSDATVNTIAHFDGTKNIESLPLATYPSLTELSYVKGVTSAIQTQINAKLSGSITSGTIPFFNGTSLVDSRIRNNYYTHSTAIIGSVSYAQAFSVYNNTEAIPLLSILNDGTSATFRLNQYFINALDNSSSIIIAPKGISGYSYKPGIYIATDSTNNQSTYTAYHNPTNTYTLVSNSSGQLMLFAINNTAGTLINAIHNKSGVQQGAWYNGGLLVGSGTKLASAASQVESTTQGFLPPRMTNAQRTAIASPAIGLMVYCTDTVEGLYVYKSTGWTFIA